MYLEAVSDLKSVLKSSIWVSQPRENGNIEGPTIWRTCESGNTENKPFWGPVNLEALKDQLWNQWTFGLFGTLKDQGCLVMQTMAAAGEGLYADTIVKRCL